MGFVARSAWDLGWIPNADKVNAPPNGLLRADNLWQDEFGVLASRPGASTAYNGSFGGNDIHSMFTSYIAGTRYRMVGGGNNVYANGTAIQNALAGSNDIYFGFQLGQILFARSTSKFKYDGTTVRNWGIANNGAKPVATPIAADGKTFATGAENGGGTIPPGPSWFAMEKKFPNGVVTWGPNHYQPSDPLYNASGAIIMEMAPTKRAVYEIDYTMEKDFTAYDAGGVGDDEDIVEMWLWMSDPRQMTSFHLEFTANTSWWDKDIFVSPDGAAGILHNDSPHRILPAPGQTLPDLPPGTVSATNVGTAVPRPPGQAPQVSPAFVSAYPNIGKLSWIGARPPVGGLGSGGQAYPNAGWMHLQWKRSDFTRQIVTAGKGWNTIRGVRLVVEASSLDLVCRADTIRIFGGAIIGSARFRYVYVRNNGTYIAKSAMSPASDMVTFDHQAAQVSIPADAGRDSQVNEIWLYRFDEQLDDYYRTQVKTGVSGTGGYLITDSKKARDAAEDNIHIERDNHVPPDNIIGIVGPHFDRTLVLTSDGQLWSSRRLDPDAFATSQVVQVCGSDDTPLWIYKAVTEVFIGTTKDIFRLEGDGAENPDGSINYALRGLNMDHRPVNEAVAHEGNQIVFFADDGWRAFDGAGGSVLLTGATSLLYHAPDGTTPGFTRHGVSQVNKQTGRFRAALGLGKFVAITPEGASTTNSTVLYRYEFAPGRWWRHTYPGTFTFRSVLRERDGTVLLGLSTGTVIQLDATFSGGDNSTRIPIVLWTKADALEMPYQRKKIGSLTWRSNASNEQIAVHLDGSDTATTTISVISNGVDAARSIFDLANAFQTDGVTANPYVIPICREIQLRVTDFVITYKLYDFAFQFRERPAPIIGKVPSGLAGAQGVKVISGFMVRCNTLGTARRFTAWIDGVADPQTFDVTTDAEENQTVPLLFTLHSRRGTDIQLAVDGEIEIDEWRTIVTQDQPVGVKLWDSGPILDNPKDLSWLRGLKFKVRAGADLVVHPWFDGTEFQPVHITVTPDADSVYLIQVGKKYMGWQPRIVVESCETFYPYWVQPIRRDSGSPSQKSKPREGMKVTAR